MSLLPRATFAFIRREWRYLSFGLLLAFWSSPGQTYVISLFGAEIRAAFNLSHGGWGEIYMYATVTSAVLLLLAGRLVDQFPVKNMARGGVVALALAAMAFPLVAGPLTLFFGFLGLRFTGQGMMGHISGTALAREYEAERGRAVAIGALGFSLGQAVFPPIIVLLLQHFDWRNIWLGMGLLALVTGLPLISVFLRHRTPKFAGQVLPRDHDGEANNFPHQADRHHWTRTQVLADARFYLLVPIIMAQSAVGTAFTFHQVYLVAEKSWSMTMWSSFYSVYALAAVVANLIAGALIDRFSARVVTPFTILPMALAFITFASFDSVLAAPLVMAFSATASATLNASLGALFVELYGTRYLGAVRSLKVFLGVFGSAIGPVIYGIFIDRGASISEIMAVSAGLIVISSLLAFLALYGPPGRRQAPPGSKT